MSVRVNENFILKGVTVIEYVGMKVERGDKETRQHAREENKRRRKVAQQIAQDKARLVYAAMKKLRKEHKALKYHTAYSKKYQNYKNYPKYRFPLRVSEFDVENHVGKKCEYYFDTGDNMVYIMFKKLPSRRICDILKKTIIEEFDNYEGPKGGTSQPLVKSVQSNICENTNFYKLRKISTKAINKSVCIVMHSKIQIWDETCGARDPENIEKENKEEIEQVCTELSAEKASKKLEEMEKEYQLSRYLGKITEDFNLKSTDEIDAITEDEAKKSVGGSCIYKFSDYNTNVYIAFKELPKKELREVVKENIISAINIKQVYPRIIRSYEGSVCLQTETTEILDKTEFRCGNSPDYEKDWNEKAVKNASKELKSLEKKYNLKKYLEKMPKDYEPDNENEYPGQVVEDSADNCVGNKCIYAFQRVEDERLKGIMQENYNKETQIFISFKKLPPKEIRNVIRKEINEVVNKTSLFDFPKIKME